MNLSLFWIALSFFLVAFGQPAWIWEFAPLTAILGYALFWKGMFLFDSSLKRFFLAVLWFTSVQAIQLSWMTTTDYMGPLLLVVYSVVIFTMGLQFGLLSWMIGSVKNLDLRHCAAFAGIWVVLEWLRLFPCTGFTWNPLGLAWTGSSLSLQAASLFGIYGLSFWVIFVNLAALRAAFLRTRAAAIIWGALALFPFLFGAIHQQSRIISKGDGRALSVLLVQTSLLPHERDFFPDQPHGWVPPLAQWARILDLIKPTISGSIDLIVLPETALPFTAFQPAYPLTEVRKIWIEAFGIDAVNAFPSLGKRTSTRLRGNWYVSNAFWLQALSKYYGCEVIVGLDDWDRHDKRFNAAFHFLPRENKISRYEKRVLVPVGEYIPLKNWRWLAEFIASRFGIGASFEPGSEGKVFSGQAKLGVSICYEETYTEMIRDLSRKGANLLVNVSNDGWFPYSRLPRQHFDHGIIRAVENGLPCIRACNTGITGGVDCFGRLLGLLPEPVAGVLQLDVPLWTSPTLYSLWGDRGILLVSISCMGLLFLKRRACSK